MMDLVDETAGEIFKLPVTGLAAEGKKIADRKGIGPMSFLKRSTLPPSPSPIKREGRGVGVTPTHESLLSGTIILLDTVGELSSIYGIADIAIIGKSFKGYGGQNPLEPAYWGKPIVSGPHMENFPFIGTSMIWVQPLKLMKKACIQA